MSLIFSTKAILALFLALNVLQSAPAVFPQFDRLSDPDESFYIHQGRLLAEGTLPYFEWSPFSAVLYAATYLAFKGSPWWLLYSGWLGRLIMFFLLLGSSYMVARRFSSIVHPAVMLFLMTVFPVYIPLLENASDALFTVFSAFSFAQTAVFLQTKKNRYLVFASCCMCLAALSRPDGIFLFLFFVPVWFFIAGDGKEKIAASAAWLIPFLLIFTAVMALYRPVLQNGNDGWRKRAYGSFERGQVQGMAPRADYRDYWTGIRASRRLYGSAEENRYSVAAAVSRNPQAYFRRLAGVARGFPRAVLRVYGGWSGWVLFCLAFTGIVLLVRKKERALAAITVLWTAPVLLNILILYRDHHFLMSFFVVFLLAAAGLNHLVSVFSSGANRIMGRKPVFRYAAVLFLALGSAAGMHGNRERFYARYQATKDTGDMAAVSFMSDNLPPGLRIFSIKSLRNIYAAGMSSVSMSETGLQAVLAGRDISDRDFLTWLRVENIGALYLDSDLRSFSPLRPCIERLRGGEFRVVFSSHAGDIEILLVDPENNS